MKFKIGDKVRVREDIFDLIPDRILTKSVISEKAGTLHKVEDLCDGRIFHQPQPVYKLSNGDGFAYWESWLEEV